MSTPVSTRQKWLRLTQVGCATFAWCVLLLRTVLTPWALPKDVFVDHLTALGLRDSWPIFTGLETLRQFYYPHAPPSYPYANFHPPVIWLINLPLTVLPFEAVAVVWLLASLAILLMVVSRLGLSWRAGLALAAWPPLYWHLWLGQYEIFIMAAAVFAWILASQGKGFWAGALLGGAATLKFYPALLLIPYLARRQWSVVAGGTLAFSAGMLVNLLVIGVDGAVYYVQGLSGVESSAILQDLGNSSPYSMILRLLGGTEYLPYLAFAPHLIMPLTIMLALASLAALAWLGPLWAPAALLVIMPNSMWYCSVLALPPLVMAWREGSLRPLTWAAAICISLPFPFIVNWLALLAPNQRFSLDVLNLLCSAQAVGYILLLVVGVAQAWRQRQESQHVPLVRAGT
ncbi:MAG: glycosyltransferase family 87 protein [Chloroflexota bacterium]